MNFVEMSKTASDEELSKAYFKSYWDKVGVVCKKCGSRDHYWKRDKEQYECKKCRFRTTLRSGTVLEASKLSYGTWLYVFWRMSTSTKPVSALQMQKELGRKRYYPIWAMMHKIRAVMGLREKGYKLDETVELDDAMVTVVKEHGSPGRKVKDEDRDGPDKKNKRGRGSEKKGVVLVLSKVEESRPGTGKTGSAFRFVKMKQIADMSSKSVIPELLEALEKNTHIKSDGMSTYEKLDEKLGIRKHTYMKVDPEKADKLLPWVHTMISNLKRNLLGIYHSVGKKYLQNYLDEFCYKVNRRYFRMELMDRLMICASVNTAYEKFRYL